MLVNVLAPVWGVPARNWQLELRSRVLGRRGPSCCSSGYPNTRSPTRPTGVEQRTTLSLLNSGGQLGRLGV